MPPEPGLDRFAGPGWLAVGDSALSFDPLSSQGLLTALYTGLRAGQAADRLLDGDDGPLEEYARRLEAIHDAYRRHRAAYYAAERRWADRTFWLRRVPGHIPPDRVAPGGGGSWAARRDWS